MKKKTKFGLLLAAVATATFYVVHKIAGKKVVKAPVASHLDHVTAPPAPAPSPPHGATVSHPNPATPADPFAPLPGQESLEGNVHFDQPGAASQTINSAPLPGQEAAAGNIHLDEEG